MRVVLYYSGICNAAFLYPCYSSLTLDSTGWWKSKFCQLHGNWTLHSTLTVKPCKGRWCHIGDLSCLFGTNNPSQPGATSFRWHTRRGVIFFTIFLLTVLSQAWGSSIAIRWPNGDATASQPSKQPSPWLRWSALIMKIISQPHEDLIAYTNSDQGNVMIAPIHECHQWHHWYKGVTTTGGEDLPQENHLAARSGEPLESNVLLWTL